MDPEKKSNGALIGSIVVIIILIIGGIYLWKASLKEKNATPETSNDTVNLEADLNSIDLENLDEEI